MKNVKVSFALRLYDDFDGKPITGIPEFFVNGRRVKSLYKPEGFHVFCGYDEAVIPLEIRYPRYQAKLCSIDVTALDPGFPKVNERLYRSRNGGFSDCEWLSVKLKNGVNARVSCLCEGLKVASLQQQEDKSVINLLGYTTAHLQGRVFSTDAEGKARFVIGEMLTPSQYLIDAVPKTSQKKNQQTLYRVYTSGASEGEEAFIPIEVSDMSRAEKIVS